VQPPTFWRKYASDPPGLAKPSLNLIEESKMAEMRSGHIILTALLLSGSVAVAQQAGKPCAGDIKTLCAGIQLGEGRIRACIKSHMADVSDPCRDAMSQAAAGKKILGGGDL
jgi:hypothetical protein